MHRTASIASVVALALAAGSAHAERRDCEVVFVRAPDEVRHVIESWLEAEPRCSGSIELRVVETESGSLYLIAQRPDGRIHEREVPDAQSAGVLVASWVADDWTSTPPADPPAAAPPPVAAAPAITAPGLATHVVARPPARPRDDSGRWLTLAGAIAMSDGGGGGLRLDVDLLGGNRTRWTLGLSGQVSKVSQTEDDGAYVAATDAHVLATATRTFRLSSRWSLRTTFSFGVLYTQARIVGYQYGDQAEYTETAMASNWGAGVFVAREVFQRDWAITAGPQVLFSSQEFHSPFIDAPMVTRRGGELMFHLGARRRL